jgi:hypothetical protein
VKSHAHSIDNGDREEKHIQGLAHDRRPLKVVLRSQTREQLAFPKQRSFIISDRERITTRVSRRWRIRQDKAGQGREAKYLCDKGTGPMTNEHGRTTGLNTDKQGVEVPVTQYTGIPT